MPKRFAFSKRSLECGRLSVSNKPFDALQNIAIVSLFICLTIFIPQIRCLSEVTDTPKSSNTNDWLDSTNTNPDSQLLGEELSSEQKLLMSTRLPRQHFRLNVMPSSSKSNFKLVKIQRSRPAKKSGSMSTTTTSSTTTPVPTLVQRLDGGEKSTSGERLRQPEDKRLPKGQGKKISSAVLRKLLTQTLPKLNSSNTFAANATDNKGPSFKFVFIQRGSQPPVTANSSGTRQPSLAANVSKQLAHSLLYSTANLIGNLSSVSSAAGSTSTPPNFQQDDLSNELAPSSPAPSSASSQAENSDLPKAASEQQQHGSTTKSRPTRKPRPSKIYNLPVKFVTNGQPNHVVFHAIKQHFATIKRLQQSVNAQSASSSGNSATKRKNAHKQSDRTRLKGKNSRLIRLPLKYLSNARPSLVNVIMATKASYKSAPALTGTSVSPS